MSYSEDEIKLKRILSAIINSTPGLKYAILTDDTGITIMSQSKFTFSEKNSISVEKIGAIGGAVFIAGEEQGHILGYGNISLHNNSTTDDVVKNIRSISTGIGIWFLFTVESSTKSWK